MPVFVIYDTGFPFALQSISNSLALEGALTKLGLKLVCFLSHLTMRIAQNLSRSGQ